MLDRAGRGAPFVVTLVVAALAGCGGESSASRDRTDQGADRSTAPQQLISQVHARRPAVRIPAGFDVRRVPSAGLALAFPRRWTTLVQPDVVFPGVIRTLSRAHRSLTPSLLGLAAPDSPLKLLAFHSRAGDRFATTATVFVGPAPPGTTFERQGQAIVRAVRRLGGIKGRVDSQRLMLPAGETHRLEYRRRGTVTVQFATVRGEQLYALVFVTRLDLERHYARQFEASARTLSFEE
jgi:hypothetical protein